MENHRLSVANVVFDPRLGGPQRRITHVAEALKPLAIDTILVLPLGQGNAAAYATDRSIETIAMEFTRPTGVKRPVELLRYALASARDILRFRRLFNEIDVDVVHVNGAFFMAPAIAARLAGPRLVWHLNDTLFPPLLSQLLGRIVVVMAHEIVAAAKVVSLHYGVEAHARTIHAPVDPLIFKARPVRSPSSGLIVGLLGNWAEVKGHDDFVRLLAALKTSHPGVIGRIIGEKFESQVEFISRVWRLAQDLNVSDRIDDIGFTQNPAEILNEIDVLVLTSRSEASPTVVLEAMSVGVPVVAFEVGGVREMLAAESEGDSEACGIVVSKGDVGAMAEAITDLVSNPDRYSEMSLRAQKRAREEYSIAACADRHVAVYLKATGVDRCVG